MSYYSYCFYEEYYPLLLSIIISSLLSLIIFGLSYFIAIHYPDTEKLSTYECGFDPYEDARNTFDVRFYLVALLFIIFDLETAFFIPWAVSLGKISSFGFWTMMDFIIELVIGYFYAWKIGALDWE